MAGAPRATGGELQAGVLGDFRRAHDLQRVAVGYVAGEFGEIGGSFRRTFHGGIAGDLHGIALRERDLFAVDGDGSFAGKADKAGFAVAVGKRLAGLGGV